MALLQMDWGEQIKALENLQKDLTQSWEYLRAIAKHETSTDHISMEKKMKCAQSLTESAQKLKVSVVISMVHIVGCVWCVFVLFLHSNCPLHSLCALGVRGGP